METEADFHHRSAQTQIVDHLGDNFTHTFAAARLTAEAGERLEAGWIVMAGGATAAEALRPGVSVRNSVQGLGSVGFSVIE